MTTIKSGTRTFSAESLSECIPWLESEGVHHVFLEWKWDERIIVYPSNSGLIPPIFALRAIYDTERIDLEYSYIGVFEEASFRKYAEDYGLWDDAELVIRNGVLVGEFEGYEDHTSEQDAINLIEYDSAVLTRFEYYDDKAHEWRLLA